MTIDKIPVVTTFGNGSLLGYVSPVVTLETDKGVIADVIGTGRYAKVAVSGANGNLHSYYPYQLRVLSSTFAADFVAWPNPGVAFDAKLTGGFVPEVVPTSGMAYMGPAGTATLFSRG